MSSPNAAKSSLLAASPRGLCFLALALAVPLCTNLWDTHLLYGTAPSLAPALDLARPEAAQNGATQLASSPPIWLTKDFLSPATVQHMLEHIPKDESAYMPCIGQVHEFKSKRCTFLPASGDPIIEAAIAKIGQAWNMDTSQLLEGGLPIIRYLPGAPPVGKHGDEDRHGVVPNATLVIYLGDGDGQTIFPEANVAVSPHRGAVLSFQNVDDAGRPHPNGQHLVSAVPHDAPSDRLVVQIPISFSSAGEAHAYPEHVSGNKNHSAGSHGQAYSFVARLYTDSACTTLQTVTPNPVSGNDGTCYPVSVGTTTHYFTADCNSGGSMGLKAYAWSSQSACTHWAANKNSTTSQSTLAFSGIHDLTGGHHTCAGSGSSYITVDCSAGAHSTTSGAAQLSVGLLMPLLFTLLLGWGSCFW